MCLTSPHPSTLRAPLHVSYPDPLGSAETLCTCRLRGKHACEIRLSLISLDPLRARATFPGRPLLMSMKKKKRAVDDEEHRDAAGICELTGSESSQAFCYDF